MRALPVQKLKVNGHFNVRDIFRGRPSVSSSQADARDEISGAKVRMGSCSGVEKLESERRARNGSSDGRGHDEAV